MYHAVADTVLANSLLRSLPEVDAEKVGVMGISWGGIITNTVMGIDDRFAFAIPTYGCGHLAKAGNQYERALAENLLYQKVWDPMVRLKEAKMPTLWLSWPGDKHFPLDKQAVCYQEMSGPFLVSLIPGLGHGHKPAWAKPDSYAFAETIVRGEGIWCRELESSRVGEQFEMSFSVNKKVDKVTLVSTVDAGIMGEREWTESSAKFEQREGQWKVTGSVPPKTTAWFVNLYCEGLVASSSFQTELEAP